MSRINLPASWRTEHDLFIARISTSPVFLHGLAYISESLNSQFPDLCDELLSEDLLDRRLQILELMGCGIFAQVDIDAEFDKDKQTSYFENASVEQWSSGFALLPKRVTQSKMMEELKVVRAIQEKVGTWVLRARKRSKSNSSSSTSSVSEESKKEAPMIKRRRYIRDDEPGVCGWQGTGFRIVEDP
jgi:hypothetical protein